MNEVTVVEKTNREKRNKQRQMNRKYYSCLSTDIKPFRKRNIKRLKIRGMVQRRSDSTYLHLKNCLFSTRPPTLDNENRLIISSRQEPTRCDLAHLDLRDCQSFELLTQPNGEIFFDQNKTISPNNNDDLGTYKLTHFETRHFLLC